MNEAGALLACILKQPNDHTPWLVLADWLQEQGDPDSVVRAELLRLRTEWANAATPISRQRKAEKRALAVLKEKPALIGPLQPLLPLKFRVLASPSALALFLLADYASGAPDHLTAGTTWEGELLQPPYAFPTTLRLCTRDGNRFEGDMTEDFAAMYGMPVDGTFYFRGVVVGEHVAFVTLRIEGAGSGPGLYQFRVNHQKRWTGTWEVGAWKGTMWLKPKRSRKGK
jgi:uncharacterized protein (TIGR02996 family)